MRNKRPYIKPVTRIELPTGNEKQRWIAVAVLLAVGICAIGYGLFQMLTVQPSWEEVTVNTRETHVGLDFKLMYDFSETGGSATSINTALTRRYSDAAVKAYQVFSSDVEIDGVQNMAYLNRHINETVTVEEELYQALSQVADSGNRQLFLAPAQVEYDRVFFAESNAEAMRYDPTRNPEIQTWLMELSRFVNNPDQIALEILGNCQVKLSVGEEYLAFAEEYGIDIFADFGWMRNAFAADLIAEELSEAGFTKGYLVSFDGFTRNLDPDGREYTQNLFDRQGDTVSLPARMHYTSPRSIVVLRDYPMTEQDRWNYYGFEDGRILTAFLDPADCMSKSACHNLVGYAEAKGCGQIVLQLADIFIADAFSEEAIDQLTLSHGIFSIWSKDNVLCNNDPALKLEILSGSNAG